MHKYINSHAFEQPRGTDKLKKKFKNTLREKM